METEEKRGSKRYTRRIYTWPAPSRARTRNNVHYASLTRFLPLSACFSAGEKCQGPERKMEGDEKSRAASLLNRWPTTTLLRSTRCLLFPRRGGREEKEISDLPRSRPIGLVTLEPVPICHWHAIASSRLSGWPRQKVYGTCQKRAK